MIYLVLLIATLVLTTLSSREWQKNRRISREALTHLHKRIAQHLVLSEWDAARRILDQITSERKATSQTGLLRISLLRQTKQYAPALSIIDNRPTNTTDTPLFQREKGRILLEMGQTRSALMAFNECRAALQDEEGALCLATALFGVDQIGQAWETLREHLGETVNGPYLALAADCRYALGDYRQALTYYQKALKSHTDSARNLGRIGHCYRQTGQLDLAAQAFETILKPDPSNIGAALNLGSCLEAQGLYDEALAVYQTTPLWEQDDRRILLRAGICAVHTDRFGFSELYLKQAIDEGLNTATSLSYFGYTLERLQKFNAAEATYFDLMHAFPDHAAGYRGLAWLYGVGLSSTIATSEGLLIARRSLKLIDDTAAWEILSACEARAGNYQEAHRILEAVAEKEANRANQQRQRSALRTLRKRLPLDEHLVAHTLVA